MIVSIFLFLPFVRGIDTELFPVVPVPLGNLGQRHAQLIANRDLCGKVPDWGPFKMD